MLETPLDKLKIEKILYHTGWNIHCLQFHSMAPNVSEKFGNDAASQVFRVRYDSPLARITVSHNRRMIIGIKFTYADQQEQEMRGSDPNGGNDGPTIDTEFEVSEGEHLVGACVETNGIQVRRISFKLMRE